MTYPLSDTPALQHTPLPLVASQRLRLDLRRIRLRPEGLCQGPFRPDLPGHGELSFFGLSKVLETEGTHVRERKEVTLPGHVSKHQELSETTSSILFRRQESPVPPFPSWEATEKFSTSLLQRYFGKCVPIKRS